VRGLEKIFSPAVVYAMSDTEVEVIASEVVCQAPEGIINLGTGSSSSSTRITVQRQPHVIQGPRHIKPVKQVYANLI
jgi:hypothetical protein